MEMCVGGTIRFVWLSRACFSWRDETTPGPFEKSYCRSIGVSPVFTIRVVAFHSARRCRANAIRFGVDPPATSTASLDSSINHIALPTAPFALENSPFSNRVNPCRSVGIPGPTPYLLLTAGWFITGPSYLERFVEEVPRHYHLNCGYAKNCNQSRFK